MIPWIYRRVLARIENKSEENRVCFQKVDPRNTSRKCPVCGMVSELNRTGEDFCCIQCGHRNDADFIGATNVLASTVRLPSSVESDGLKKDIMVNCNG